MKETLKDLKERRSVRAYKAEQIKDEELEQVLEATGRPTYVEDGSLAMGNLMNAAQAVGLGSCWIHRAKEEFESEEGKKLLEKWGLGENYAGVGHCALGYADGEKPAAKERREGRIILV